MPKRRLISVALSLPLAFGALLAGHGIWNESLAQIEDQTPFENVAPVEPDPENGEKIFKKCKNCHTVKPDEKKIGPSLAGIVGRRPGSVEDFGYSQEMIDFGAAGNIWNEETLDLFLTKPRDLIRRTKMAFPGFKKQGDRADLIAYLSQF